LQKPVADLGSRDMRAKRRCARIASLCAPHPDRG
jgi:hypothetical protein